MKMEYPDLRTFRSKQPSITGGGDTMGFVIGIDSGGTKTRGLLARYDGCVTASATEGPSNIQNNGLDNATTLFLSICQQLIHDAGIKWQDISHVALGVGGLDTKTDEVNVNSKIKEVLPDGVRFTCANDSVVGLYSGTFGDPGIVAVSGTGSIISSVDEEGVFRRAGGWGSLSRDAGSGYTIGQDALIAALADHDDTGPETLLTQLICSEHHVAQVPDVLNRMYRSETREKDLASLARLVSQAAEAGDKIALSLLNQAGRDLGELVVRLAEKMKMSSKIPVVMVGSVINSRFVKAAFTAHVTFALPQSRILSPAVDPAAGAVIMGMKQTGVEITADVIQNLRRNAQ